MKILDTDLHTQRVQSAAVFLEAASNKIFSSSYFYNEPVNCLAATSSSFSSAEWFVIKDTETGAGIGWSVSRIRKNSTRYSQAIFFMHLALCRNLIAPHMEVSITEDRPTEWMQFVMSVHHSLGADIFEAISSPPDDSYLIDVSPIAEREISTTEVTLDFGSIPLSHKQLLTVRKGITLRFTCESDIPITANLVVDGVPWVKGTVKIQGEQALLKVTEILFRPESTLKKILKSTQLLDVSGE